MRAGAVLAAWLVLSTPPAAWAQSSAPSPEDVEAAYLYQFGHYLEEPPDVLGESATCDIGLIGMDRLGAALGVAVRVDR